jgi:hypothetical protein
MAAGNTYVAIATQTLGSAVSSVTFSSIPATYTDLILVTQYMNSANGGLFLQYNGDSGTNYSVINVISSATFSTSSYVDPDEPYIWADTYLQGTGSVTTDRPMTISHIMNYANTTTFKTTLLRSGDVRTTSSTDGTSYMGVALWRNTSAINSITVLSGAGNFIVTSTFSLYGIASA